MMDLFLINTQMVVDRLESCGLLEDYCDVLSAVWTLIVTAPIRCRGSIVMLNFIQICSDEETNSSTSWMACGWILFSAFTFFGVNYSFKQPFVDVDVSLDSISDIHRIKTPHLNIARLLQILDILNNRHLWGKTWLLIKDLWQHTCRFESMSRTASLLKGIVPTQ